MVQNTLSLLKFTELQYKLVLVIFYNSFKFEIFISIILFIIFE